MPRPAQAPTRRRADAFVDMSAREAPPTLDLERFLPYRLSVLAQRVSADLHARYAGRFGLTVAQWRVMACLGRFAPVSANEVCVRIVMDKVAVSRALAAMTSTGLVEATTDPLDRRRGVLRLTPKGRDVHAAIAPLALDYEATLWAGLTPGERAAFDALLGKLDTHARSMSDPDAADTG